MHDQTIAHYDVNAAKFSAQYQAAEPGALQKLLGQWLPSSGRVLEIGCGSGRDAVFMAGLGLSVTATDGSAGMLEQARLQAVTSLSPEAASRLSFQNAVFPLPSGHALLTEKFDAVVAVAILMHIPDQAFFDFAFQVRSLLKPRGRFICSFCAGRESSEADPRLYVNREPGEVRLMFERLGFIVLTQEDSWDSLNRGIRWTTLVFGYDHAAGSRPVDQIEAVETVALQRGVERWEPKGVAVETAYSGAVGDRRPTSSDSCYSRDSDAKKTVADDGALLSPEEVEKRAYVSALPIVARLAASTTFFDGFLTGSINDVTELNWIAVPPRLCKPKRFVIRVAGDSMEPLFKVGDLLVFEYHRTPRSDSQIVIAADFTSGNSEYAVKRYKAHPTLWRFLSENPAYAPVEIEQAEMPFPILGTFVGKIEKE